MKDYGLVSIIMPLYNYGKYLSSAINSVKQQTYPFWELIIVDDCSTDDSYDIALSLCKSDSRIKVFRLEKNSGTSVARNFALDHASGKYIAFLDSDDEYDNDYLESQVNNICSTNSDISVASYRRNAPKSLTDFIVPDSISYKLILKGNPMSTLGTMYVFSRFASLRFLTDMKKCEDYVFFLTMLKEGGRVASNKKVIATVNIHKGSKSKNKIKLIKWQLISYKKIGIPLFKRFFYLVCWALYGLKKYKNVV